MRSSTTSSLDSTGASAWKSVPIYRYVPRLFFSGRRSVGVHPPTQRSGGGHQLDTTKLEPRCRVAVPATLKQYIGLFSPPSWIGVCRSFFLPTIPAIRTDDAHNAF